MPAEVSPSKIALEKERGEKERDDRRRVLIALLFLLLSFGCIFCSSQTALWFVDRERVEASMLSGERADYGAGPEIALAPLDEGIGAEADRDEEDLLQNQTPIAQGLPVAVLPNPVPTPSPTPTSPPATPVAVAPTPTPTAPPSTAVGSTPTVPPPVVPTTPVPVATTPVVVPTTPVVVPTTPVVVPTTPVVVPTTPVVVPTTPVVVPTTPVVVPTTPVVVPTTPAPPLPVVAFSSATFSVDEPAGNAIITVILSASSAQTVMVNYATSDFTAIAGSDYTATSGSLTFSPGQTSRTFSVPIINDSLDEVNEAISLSLSNPSNATLGTPASAQLTIVDDDGLPTVQFSSSVYSINENAGTATINVTLSPASGQVVTVNYATSNFTAVAGSDYTATSGTLTFSPGQTNLTFSVPIIDDTLDEADEALLLTLSLPTNANALLGAPASAQLTIVDNDALPIVDFSNPTYSVNENAGTATITVMLSPISGQVVTVDYATSDGSAGGSDYTSTSGTLTFLPGATSATFTVPIINDSLDEPNETVVLSLSNAGSATLGGPNNPAILTIVDDGDLAPTVDFSSPVYSVNENGSPAIITVTLSAASGFTINVDYATISGGTATAGSDYITATGRLTFTPGLISQTFPITINNDLVGELDETVVLNLSNASNATLGSINNPASLTIVDDEGQPTVDFSSSTYSVNETDGTAPIIVTLSFASAQTVTVDYATSDGTAIAGNDYTTTTGSLIFPPGIVSQGFAVPINADGLYEAAETVILSLSNAISATLGVTNPATLTIINSDPAPVVDFSSPTYSVNEIDGAATITVTLTPASAVTATVNYTTSDGTATATDDYVLVAGTLTFAPGQLSQTFSVPIVDDSLANEGNETVLLQLSNPVDATLVGSINNPAILTIVDDEATPTVQFSLSPYPVAEDVGTAPIDVTLNTASALTVTVNYSSTNGTAKFGADYTPISGTLTFGPSVTNQSFDVTIINDAGAEPTETFTLTLSNPGAALLGIPNPAIVEITDDGDSGSCETFVFTNVIEIGPPDCKWTVITAPSFITVDLSLAGTPLTVDGDPEDDLIYYERETTFAPFPPSSIALDMVSIEVSTDTVTWYPVFVWGDAITDTNTSIGRAGYGPASPGPQAPAESDDKIIPMTTPPLYGPSGGIISGITIDVDNPAVGLPPPPGTYQYVRITDLGGAAQAAEVDSIDFLPP